MSAPLTDSRKRIPPPPNIFLTLPFVLFFFSFSLCLPSKLMQAVQLSTPVFRFWQFFRQFRRARGQVPSRFVDLSPALTNFATPAEKCFEIIIINAIGRGRLYLMSVLHAFFYPPCPPFFRTACVAADTRIIVYVFWIMWT